MISGVGAGDTATTIDSRTVKRMGLAYSICSWRGSRSGGVVFAEIALGNVVG